MLNRITTLKLESFYDAMRGRLETVKDRDMEVDLTPGRSPRLRHRDCICKLVNQVSGSYSSQSKKSFELPPLSDTLSIQHCTPEPDSKFD